MRTFQCVNQECREKFSSVIDIPGQVFFDEEGDVIQGVHYWPTPIHGVCGMEMIQVPTPG